MTDLGLARKGILNVTSADVDLLGDTIHGSHTT